MFSSWQVRCGIADYTSNLVEALQTLGNTKVTIIPFDRQTHPALDYARWGQAMNEGDVAHLQHEYTFFGYLLPWRNHFNIFASQIRHPFIITKHVSFDGPLGLAGRGPSHLLRQIKWAMYNRWLGPYATYLNRNTFDIADQIIVLSNRLKQQLVERGIHEAKIHVIPAGVPTVLPAIGDNRLRHDWNWQTKRVIAQFGFITPAKGHLIALDALAHLPDEYVLLIAGGLRRERDRLALDAIQRRITELRLESRVRITGYLNATDIPALIGVSDILVFPYTHADSSYSIVTSLAYQSAPVIASDIYAHRELAEWCQGIELFRNNDSADLTHKIQKIFHEQDRRETMRRRIAQFVHDFSWHTIANKTLGVYEHALETHQMRQH